MSIDFFTFAAQILNLLILLFLLRKFLYLPVLKAVSERQAFIEQELQKAADSHKKAQKMEQECQLKMAEIEAERRQILAQTRITAENLAQKLTQEAKKEFENARRQWQEKLQGEQRAYGLAVRNLAAENFRVFAESALKQLADTDLNAFMLQRFKEKVTALPSKKKTEFSEAFNRNGVVEVSAAQRLAPEIRKSLERFLREQLQLNEEIKIKFRVAPELVCGISVRAKEQVVFWNLEAYLADFEKNMNEQIAGLANGG